MKQLIIVIFTFLCNTALTSQDSIVWDFNSKMDTNLINRTLKIINVNNFDSIYFNKIIGFKTFNCINNNTLFLRIQQIGQSDTFSVIYCDDSISLKMEDDKSIQLIKTDRVSINFKYNSDLIKSRNTQYTFKSYIGEHKSDDKNLYFDSKLLLNGDQLSKNYILIKYNIDTNNSYLKEILKSQLLDSIKLEQIFQKKGGLQKGSLNDPNYTSQSNNLSSMIGLDITTYADGLAKFLVSRVKEELAIAYFNRFASAIRDSSIRDAQILFKNTYDVLDLVADRIYDFKPYLNTIRDGMEEDFKNLSETVMTLIKDKDSQLSKSIDTIQNARMITTNLLSLFIDIKNEDHIGTAFNNLDPVSFLTNKHTDTILIGTLQTLQLFSKAFKDTLSISDSIYWVSKENIYQLINNEDFLNCFLGLVTAEAKEKNIIFNDTLELYSLLNDNNGPKKLKEFKSIFSSMKSTFGKIQTIHHKFKNTSDDATKGSIIAEYFDAANELIAICNEINAVFNLKQKKSIQNLVTLSDDLSAIVKNVSIKRYSAASTHLAHLFKDLKVDQVDWRWHKLVNFIVEKSMFVSQMAEAESSDQVDSLLRIYAAPVGSWRDKRESKWNMAVDTYLGVGGFYSQKSSNDHPSKDIGDIRYNLSSPVGLSISKSIGNYNATVMLSMVDIGPITSFRFKSDTGEIPKVSLNEIVSPGIQTSFHFGRKFPLTLNIGYQEYPLLNRISANSNDYNLTRRGGISFSLNMNIPLFTLVNQKKESASYHNILSKEKMHLNSLKLNDEEIQKIKCKMDRKKLKYDKAKVEYEIKRK